MPSKKELQRQRDIERLREIRRQRKLLKESTSGQEQAAAPTSTATLEPIVAGGGGEDTNSEDEDESERVYGKKKNKEEEEDVHQCFALDCTSSSRPGSKYCSQECCIRLATARLNLFMPSRFAEWERNPSVAEIKNREQLEVLEEQIKVARQNVEMLEKRRKEFDEYVLTVEKLVVNPDLRGTNDSGAGQQGQEDGTTDCVTCGKTLAQKSLIKHMEQCFIKLESSQELCSTNASFRPVGGPPILCDEFNPRDSTYCKKFYSTCAKHRKKSGVKIGTWAVCGFPLVANVNQFTEEMCRSQKVKCNKHVGWEMTQTAAIDVERLNGWTKLDDLVLEERRHRAAIQDRGNVLALLLHKTIDHDPENPPHQVQSYLRKKKKLRQQE